MNIKLITFFLCLLPYLSVGLQAQEKESDTEHSFEFAIGVEYRFFFEEGQFPDQVDHYPSLSFRPSYELSWEDGYQRLVAEGFFRLDRDAKRTHGDVRELYYQKAKNEWEVSLGVKKIFWGVTESNHLVDIINQTDQVESFDGEQKLGQPMLQYSRITRLGTFDLFYLPFHRRRTFPGSEGRFRFESVLAENDIGYEKRQLKAWRPSAAIRWSHYFGILDIAASYFHGVGREPLITFSPTGEIGAVYPVIHQPGLELQITHDAFLWKLEAIYRDAELQDFTALAAGLE